MSIDVVEVFFFQAEDGIRDLNVTGVQTCALPILALLFHFTGCLMLLACAMLFAVLSTSTFLAVLFTMGVYFAGQYLERVITLLRMSVEGDGAIVRFLQWVAWIIPNLTAFDLKQHAAYGLTLEPSLAFCTLLYGLSYTALVLLLATLVFSRKELS